MKKITKPQLSKIHVLLNQFNLKEFKPDLVFLFTKRRTEHSSEMLASEAALLIAHLSTLDPCDRIRKKVFALAYEAGIIYGNTPDDKKMHAAKLNLFLKDRGTIRKELSHMTKDELIKVANQFEQIIKHKNSSSASKLTKGLLSELGIQTQTKSDSKPA